MPAWNVAERARHLAGPTRDTFDPNVSFLAANQWEGDDGRLRRIDQPELWAHPLARPERDRGRHGAVRRRHRGAIPPGFTPIQRVFNGDPADLGCRHRPRPADRAGFDAGFRHGSRTSANFPYLLARDALFASDFEGDRERPAANIALQFAPNDTSEYTFEAFYQGYREDMFNNLHFTFADWWGALGPDPGIDDHDVSGHQFIKTRTVGFPFGFNSGDSTEQSTDSSSMH